MECREQIVGDSVMRVLLSGRMTFNDHIEMKRITRYVIAERMRHVFVDLSDLNFIDSAAIGMFLILNDELRGVHGTMILEKPQGQVARVLSVAKIHDLIAMPHHFIDHTAAD